jgi:hypothetical protein
MKYILIILYTASLTIAYNALIKDLPHKYKILGISISLILLIIAFTLQFIMENKRK